LHALSSFLLRDLAVSLRPDDKVPVIRQDAIREDADGIAPEGFSGDDQNWLKCSLMSQTKDVTTQTDEHPRGVAGLSQRETPIRKMS
jgi:hypothetical protein